MKEKCFFLKEAGSATNYPSDIPLKFEYDISGCKLFVSKGKI